jgi:hypothetical protein
MQDIGTVGVRGALKIGGYKIPAINILPRGYKSVRLACRTVHMALSQKPSVSRVLSVAFWPSGRWFGFYE